MSEALVVWLVICACVWVVTATLGWPTWAAALVWAALGLVMLGADK